MLYCREKYNNLPQTITFIPSGCFGHISLKREMCVFGQFSSYKRLWEIFDIFIGNRTEIRMDSYACTNYKSKDLRGRIYKSTHSEVQKRMDFHLREGLALFATSSIHGLVGCPWNGCRLSHHARDVVLSFYVVVVAVKLWSVIFFFFECFKKNL